jgi:flagellar hook-associated protein 1 FlgK
VASLSQVVNADVTVAGDGSYDIAVAGQSLVDASGAHALKVVDSAADSSRRVIAYQDAGGATRKLNDSQISGGSLGGLLAFRDDSLQPAQLKLNQLAHDFAARVNNVHEQGFDLKGVKGGALFSSGQPESYANANNTDKTPPSVHFTKDKKLDVTSEDKLSKALANDSTAHIKASNYQVVYEGKNKYQVTRLSDGKQKTFTKQVFSIDGLNIKIEGQPTKGDSFLIKPMTNAASSFNVAVSDPAKIAAAGQSGKVGDNSNALALADLENAKTVEGNRSFNDDYAQLVADIGNKTQTLQTNSDAEKTLTSELTQAQQSVSGVNLNEESVNLVYYQQMYQANAQVIRTASTLFDTLLNAV